MKLKRRYLIPTAIVLVLGAVFFTFFYWWNTNSVAVSGNTSKVRYLVTKGSSAESIAQDLYGKGLIKSPLAFKLYVQVNGVAGRINAGEFLISPSMTLKQIVKTFQGKPTEVWVTIPEGLRKEQMPKKFTDAMELTSDEAEAFSSEFLKLAEGKEGYLFPDTYLLPRTASASAALVIMQDTFQEKTAAYKADIESSRYSLAQIVTMASMIERETKGDEERPIVAGILYKRLEAGWPLQVDATVQYAVASSECTFEDCDDWWPVLTKSDMAIESPYNSYLNRGLPPTPVANPGLSSIRAAVDPVDSPYWFYIHDDSGNIHYAKTIEEHNANVRKYLGK